MVKFANWSGLVQTTGVQLKTYKTDNGSWLGWLETNGSLLGFVDTDWNLVPMESAA